MRNSKKAFTLVEIMAASAIMTLIVLGVLSITGNILTTWNRASGEMKNNFDATVVGNILQEDFEGILIKKDGRAWLEIDYPEDIGMLTGTDNRNVTPLKPPSMMFYSSTLLRPRYTKDQISTATQMGAASAIPIPGSVCAVKYQISVKSPFMQAASDTTSNEKQYNAFYGLYRAVVDPRTTVLETMGEELQGYTSDPTSDYFRNAISRNVWEGACTVIDEDGLEQPSQDMRLWALSPENLLVMNIVDFRVTIGVFYENESAGLNESPYKVAYIPPGTPVTVGPRILASNAYSIGSGGEMYPIDPRLVEEGTLAFADFSMTFISDAGAKEMRALMVGGKLTEDVFKSLVLQYGNTVTKRVQFISEN